MFFILLKTKTVFLIGFIIGVILAFLLTLAEDFMIGESACKSMKMKLLRNGKRVTNDKSPLNFDNKITKEEENLYREIHASSYKDWLNNQSVKISRTNMDELMYADESASRHRMRENINNKINNKTNKIQMLESDWLKSKIHITCVVFVDKIKLAESIKDTWAPHCNKIYYFSIEKEDESIPVINFGIKLTSSWQFLCQSMNYISRDYHSNDNNNETNDNEYVGKRLEWLIFVKDDMIVIAENLRHLVAHLDFQKDYYLGHPVVLWGQAYNVAEAGYVLSKGAFSKIARNFDDKEKCAAGGKYWKKEDYYLGKHLRSFGIHPLDTRDEDLSGIFHGYSLQILLWGVAKSGRYWTHALYPIGTNCCSSKSVTFNAAEADKMHNLYYMLYRLNIYQDNGIFGNRAAPTELPVEEMWKTILKEEFNITNLNEISSQRYYEIWRERYSEPEQFIMKNYKNMPDVLSSLLTAYEAERKLDKVNNITSSLI